MKEDYYNILNVSKNSSAEEIKKAYRKLAIKWHPDKNKGDADAEEQFKKISEAYDILSDPTKRAKYDQFGHAAFQQGGGGNGGGFHSDPFDMFNSFFGGGGGATFSDMFGGSHSRSNRQRQNKGHDLKFDLSVSFVDIIRGNNVDINYNKRKKCNKCSGTKTTSKSQVFKCQVCKGSGVVYSNMGIMQVQQICPSCQGNGEQITNQCTNCDQNGLIQTKEKIKINIPKGCNHGTRLRISRGGDDCPNGTPGDLYVIIHANQSDKFKRDGDNLICEETIPFYDIILGTSKLIDTPHGQIKLKIPSNSQPDVVLKVASHGLPNQTTHIMGDLFVVVKVELPRHLNEKQIELLKTYRSL